MDRTVGPLDKNLLTNSWSIKLRHTVPVDYLSKTKVMNKLRRESVKNFLQLTNSNRQFSSHMQSNRLDKEGVQLVKRRQSDSQNRITQRQKNNFNSSLRWPDQDVDIMLPKISHTEPSLVADKVDRIGKIDKDDTTFVKVYKKGGIFKPQSLYLGKQGYPRSPPPSRQSSQNFDLISYDCSDDKIERNETTVRKKKGLRVTWSSLGNNESRQGIRADDTCSTISGRTDDVSTPSTIKSSQSESFIFRKPQYRTKRSKVESIGIRWNIPQEKKMKRMTTTLPGQLSKNTVPMTLGLEREGTSVKKLKWQIQRSNTNLTSTDVYKAWLAKLELLKNPIPPPEKTIADATKRVTIQI